MISADAAGVMQLRTIEMNAEGFDSFALCSESQNDPARIAAEQAAAVQAAAELERRQISLDFAGGLDTYNRRARAVKGSTK